MNEKINNKLKHSFEKYKLMPEQIKASIWFVICGFLQKAVSLLTTPIFSRLLTTSEYGIFNVFQSWQGIITIFASLNLASGVYLRGLIKFEVDKDEFTASLNSLFCAVYLIVIFLYFLFSDFWTEIIELPNIIMYVMFGDIFLQTGFHFWSARQRVNFKYKNLVILTIINVVLRPTLGIFAVLNFSNKVEARIYSILITDALSFGLISIQMILHKGKIISFKYWKYALKYNLPLVPHYLSQIVLNTSDRIMINNLVDSSKAGIYSLAYSAAAILTIVNQSILNSYNPWMYKKIRDADYKKIPVVSYSILLIVAILNLILITCAPEIILVMAPASYVEAIWVIPPVTMSVYFMFLYSLFANFEFYYEKTNYMMIASIIGAVLNVILNYVFIPQYGYLAAGYTTLVCYLLYCIAHYILMKSILRKQLPEVKMYNMKLILMISIIFVLVSICAMLLYEKPLIRYSMVIVLLIVCIMNKDKAIELKKVFNEKEGRT